MDEFDALSNLEDPEEVSVDGAVWIMGQIMSTVGQFMTAMAELGGQLPESREMSCGIEADHFVRDETGISFSAPAKERRALRVVLLDMRCMSLIFAMMNLMKSDPAMAAEVGASPEALESLGALMNGSVADPANAIDVGTIDQVLDTVNAEHLTDGDLDAWKRCLAHIRDERTSDGGKEELDHLLTHLSAL